MAIDKKDIINLWGLAAGRCSHPDCNIDCVQFFNASNPIIIGEMAHVIAQREKGPRGIRGGGNDTYENLILLCPTHHTVIDKAPPGIFPEEMLHDWKNRHEARVREALTPRTMPDKNGLCKEISYLLSENYEIWKTFGPESEEARRNPVSTSVQIWNLRKLNRIVPNNRKIINLLKGNRNFFSIEEYAICSEFMVHAEGFEGNCYVRRESIPRFPDKFRELIVKNAKVQ